IAEAGIDKNLNCTSFSTTIGSDAVIPNATYSWSPSSGLSSSTVSIPTANPSVTTTYTLTLTDNTSGCTATDEVVVTVDKNTPIAEAGIDKNLNCITISTTIGSDAVIPNANYSWSPSTGLSSTNASIITANPSVTTTYTLTVTNASGCTATDAVVVTVDKTLPSIAITNTNNLTCTNSSVTRTASGGESYNWSNSLGSNASVNISVAGTYTVTVTSANGCTATATTVVTTDRDIPNVSIVSTVDTLTCTKTQAVLTATFSPAGTYTYLWSNGTTLSNLTVGDAGTYSVEVTAANGCKASASIVIVKFNAVTAQVDITDILCKGGNSGTITVKGFDGIPPYQFKLNSGSFQSNNVFGNLVTGSYSVTIKDAGGCTASVNVTVKEPINPLSISLVSTNIKCNSGNDGQIIATATGGIPTYQFLINGNTPSPSNIFSSLTAGTYTVSTIDGNNCTNTVTTTLTQPTKIIVTATGTMIDCTTPKGTVTALASGGTPTYQYSIDGTNFQASGSFANLNGGIYTITVKNINACLGTATAVITVADTVKPTFKATVIPLTCTGGTTNIDGKITISNIVNGIKYQYSAGGTFNAGTATPTIATTIPPSGILSNSLPNPSGNSQIYTIRVYNNNDCFKDVTVELMKHVCACKVDICLPYKITKTKSR
ncbi:SprB repeat-containing protein, partial [Emticicia sp.]|uniref:SprB repeat-containing protein n=1 Tax=Emticicia sp. TaxID=1930953 RepID=UPI0037504BBD